MFSIPWIILDSPCSTERQALTRAVVMATLKLS